ncbi:unnamed protein product [Nesidiocoris tenuis]|uniref:Protein krueppel n=1 Tax=Nesidiocoris tenuis TaxID=355587 RepID=A0A6H5H5N7_9HEMI|nr:unnamed protein product [Nesidiocoris tenuis]
MDSTDLSKVCRLCLKGGDVLCPIFGNHTSNGRPSLPQRIMSCAQIKISEGDGLPNNVCTPCITQVDRSYQFKLLCEQSDITLRGSMKEGQMTDDESLEEAEQWDMTKFMPEVIIKEDNDISEDNNAMNGNYSQDGDSEDHQYQSHQSLPPPPLYPLASMLVDQTLLQQVANLAPTDQYQDTRQQMFLERVIQQHNQQQNHRSEQPSLTQELLQPARSRRCRGGDKLFKCRQCNKSYSFSSALSRHKAVHNTALRPHVCQICKKGFTQEDKLVRHQKTHSMDFFMACDLCQRPFKSFTAYQRHRITGGCMMMNNGQAALQTQLQMQLQGQVQPDDVRRTRQQVQHENLQRQETSDDAPQEPHDADDPEASPTDQSSAHAQNSTGRISGKGKPEFQCKVNLMEHYQRKHSLVRPYICDVCAARFVTKQELVRHYRKHIGE